MTADHLHRFVRDARARVAAGAYAPTGDPLEPNGSLTSVEGIIAELKPRSPSAGRLLRGDAKSVLDAYRRGHAAAVSCLTDADHFDGDPSLLRDAHATGLPVLMKDFVVDERQLQCARHHGASAVLLIEACFASNETREAMVATAHGLGLEVLLEVEPSNAGGIDGTAADLIGVNARDLRTLHVDGAASLPAIAELSRAGHRVIALSGIQDRHDVRQAREAGASAVLVGSHLVGHDDPRLALVALQRPLAKACGLRDPSALQAAAGADMAGFVVGSPTSPRDIPVPAATRLIAAACGLGISPVLVTSSTDPEAVSAWAAAARPDWIQVHGFRPPPAWIAAQRQAGRGVIAAVTAGATDLPPCAILIDAPEPGSGEPIDWEAARRTVEAAGARLTLIAGGLHDGNVATALAATGATGADASSGLESRPGIKDPYRVRAFIAAAQEAP